jgi:hypothetical protein
MSHKVDTRLYVSRPSHVDNFDVPGTAWRADARERRLVNVTWCGTFSGECGPCAHGSPDANAARAVEPRLFDTFSHQLVNAALAV